MNTQNLKERKFSLFETKEQTANPQNITLEEFFLMVQNPTNAVQNICSQIQKNIHNYIAGAINPQKSKTDKNFLALKKERDNLKGQLPAACISGVFTNRSKLGLASHSGFMQIDIDFPTNQKINFRELKKLLVLDPFLCGVFCGASGYDYGIKAVVSIPICQNSGEHTQIFKSLESYFSVNYGAVIDPQTKDITRLCFVNADKEIFINYNAKTYNATNLFHLTMKNAQTLKLQSEKLQTMTRQTEATQTEKPQTEALHTQIPKTEPQTNDFLERAYKEHINQRYTTQSKFKSVFELCENWLSKGGCFFVDGNKSIFRFRLGFLLGEFGVSETEALNYTLSNYASVTSETKTKNDFFSGYKRANFGVRAFTPFAEKNTYNVHQTQKNTSGGISDLLQRALNSAVDLNKEITENFCFTYTDIAGQTYNLGSFGNLIFFSGKAKSRKTTFVSALLNSVFSKERVLGFSFDLPANSNVVYFDTEQSEFDTQRTMKRIFEQTNLNHNDFQNFKGLQLRQFEIKERFEIIKEYLEYKSPKLVVLDGIADLIMNNNDIVECNLLLQNLIKLIDKHKCLFITIVHQNKGNGFATGHLGSFLEKKCQCHISIEKDTENSLISNVLPQLVRSSIDNFKLSFEMENNKVVWAGGASQGQQPTGKLLAQIKEVFEACNATEMPAKDFKAYFMNRFEVGFEMVKKEIAKAKDLKFIGSFGNTKHTIYKLLV